VSGGEERGTLFKSLVYDGDLEASGKWTLCIKGFSLSTSSSSSFSSSASSSYFPIEEVS
jgi:hypothetical protein